MRLGRATVSRKTPGDGKLEINEVAAGRLEGLAAPFAIDVDGQSDTAIVSSFRCTCRGPEVLHGHYFVQSESLKRLAPGTDLQLEFEPSEERLVLRRLVPGA